MRKKIVSILVVISMAILLIGFTWKTIDPDSEFAFMLYFVGWIVSLLAVGYVSTPTGSVYGKIAFAFVCIMVAGVVMKILHLIAANETIIGGLLGLAVAFLVAWSKKEKT